MDLLQVLPRSLALSDAQDGDLLGLPLGSQVVPRVSVALVVVAHAQLENRGADSRVGDMQLAPAIGLPGTSALPRVLKGVGPMRARSQAQHCLPTAQMRERWAAKRQAKFLEAQNHTIVQAAQVMETSALRSNVLVLAKRQSSGAMTLVLKYRKSENVKKHAFIYQTPT